MSCHSKKEKKRSPVPRKEASGRGRVSQNLRHTGGSRFATITVMTNSRKTDGDRNNSQSARATDRSDSDPRIAVFVVHGSCLGIERFSHLIVSLISSSLNIQYLKSSVFRDRRMARLKNWLNDEKSGGNISYLNRQSEKSLPI